MRSLTVVRSSSASLPAPYSSEANGRLGSHNPDSSCRTAAPTSVPRCKPQRDGSESRSRLEPERERHRTIQPASNNATVMMRIRSAFMRARWVQLRRVCCGEEIAKGKALVPQDHLPNADGDWLREDGAGGHEC